MVPQGTLSDVPSLSTVNYPSKSTEVSMFSIRKACHPTYSTTCYRSLNDYYKDRVTIEENV